MLMLVPCRLSTDVDESDLDASDAEFLRLRELNRMVERVYGGRTSGGAPVARAVDRDDGRGRAPAAPGDDPAKEAPRSPS